ncbi:hypothetical protein BDA99DRAFT_516986 [Phascolomyces articulosus]|uniref:Polysaccharide lyase 14 domain-containing protein n=1 Tax=Phascolomyces articulosus TaxID=60185 RepID=A0AAD5JW23_9FUNG|nr:hypothetical protein BDA99DRAFT_516986 [Phascolomyces articulosus]
MNLIHRLLLLLFLIVFIITTSQYVMASTTYSVKQVWTFKNWNNYINDTSDDTSAWRKAWGIPPNSTEGWIWPSGRGTDYNNHRVVDDPAVIIPIGEEESRGVEKVLQITYPKGSINPKGTLGPQGGIGFYAEPIVLHEQAKFAIFEYQVYFPKDFDFVLGGKLPGLYGGRPAEICSGGVHTDICFSTRTMWRREGDGELYAYVPEDQQRNDLCEQQGVFCDATYGYSLGRGAWTFKTGEWIKVKQSLYLNQPGKTNGKIKLSVDGKKVYALKDLLFVSENADPALRIAFHTFFGGSKIEWAATKDEYTYFKDISLKIYY